MHTARVCIAHLLGDVHLQHVRLGHCPAQNKVSSLPRGVAARHAHGLLEEYPPDVILGYQLSALEDHFQRPCGILTCVERQ